MPDRVGRRRGERTINDRLDEVLVDPASPDREWSSARFYLLWFVWAFIVLTFADSEFRDAGAYTTIILALIGAVVAPKLLDLKVAIGQAASAIGRKFTRTEETTVQEEEEVVEPEAVPTDPEEETEEEPEEEPEPEPEPAPKKPGHGGHHHH